MSNKGSCGGLEEEVRNFIDIDMVCSFLLSYYIQGKSWSPIGINLL